MNDSTPPPKRPESDSDSSPPPPKRSKPESSPPPSQIPKTGPESSLLQWCRKGPTYQLDLSDIVLMYSRFYTMHHKANDHIKEVLKRRYKRGRDDEFVEMMEWILWLNEVD
jgi:hypothetical protein